MAVWNSDCFFQKWEIAIAIDGHGTEKYITGKLLGSSADRKWSRLLAERWTHQAGELPSILPRDTELAILLRGKTLVDRRGGGMCQRTFGTRGTIWLCPSGIREDYIHLSEPVEDCLHVYLPGRPFEDAVLQELDLDPASITLRYESIAQDPFIEQMALRVLQELNAETSCGHLLVEALSTALSVHLVHHYSATNIRCKPSFQSDKPLDGRRLARVIEFIDAHIDGELTVADMARVACLSPAHFARSFKAAVGRPPPSLRQREAT